MRRPLETRYIEVHPGATTGLADSSHPVIR
jgi:hypothetical protein